MHVYGIYRSQSRHSARLFLQASELGPPPPHTQASVYLPFGSGRRGGGRYTRLRERGWGGPNSDEGTDNAVL
jgi:hypothetical protein